MPFTDYLQALRTAMGMGRLPVLHLPGAPARLAARMGRWLPGSLLDEDALRMLDIAQQAARTNTELTPQYWRYFRIWVTLGIPAFIAFVVIFWPMVAKPA